MPLIRESNAREMCVWQAAQKVIADTNKQTFRTEAEKEKILNNMNPSNLIAGETLKQCMCVPPVSVYIHREESHNTISTSSHTFKWH
jgi:hypothetical protein